MLEVLIVLLAIIALWVFGQCTLYFINSSGIRNAQNELAITAGFTGVVILVNLLYYVAGLSMFHVRSVLLACLLVAACFLIAVRRRLNPDTGILVWTVAIFTILILPALIGGEQYYVFRGNWWDHFTYITGAYGFANHTLSSIINFNTQTFLSNELLAVANGHYGARPSVMLLFSLFLVDGQGDIFLRAFLYTSALLAMAYPPLYLICKRIRDASSADAGSSWLLRLLPAGFIVGFWGQYIFDINAWGQLASLSLTLAFIAAFMTLLQTWLQNHQLYHAPPLIPYLLSVLLFAGAWIVYPESALVHIFMLGVATLSWILIARVKVALKSFAWLAALPLFSLLFALPNYETTISFILGQSRFGATTQNDWWIFHDAYIVGIEPPMTELVNNFRSMDFTGILTNYWYVPFNSILALFGLYFVTPARNAGMLWFPWAVLTTAVAILFVVSFGRNVARDFRSSSVAAYLPKALALTGLCICSYFFVRHRWWPAGKLLSYISPYLYLVMMLPLLIQGMAAQRYLLDAAARGVAVILLVLSLGFGAARVYSSTDPYGIGFYRNYPSIQGPDNKVRIAWDFNVEAAGSCAAVNVDSLFNNPFYAHYAKLKLAYAGIPFYTTMPIVGYFGKDDPIGVMPFVHTDCDVILQSDKDYRIHAVTVRR